MDLQKIVVLCAGVVVIGGGAWFLFSGNSAEAPANQPATTENNGGVPEQQDAALKADLDDERVTGDGSLLDLLARGKSMKCDYKYSDNQGNTGSGTGYFDGGERMRVESTYSDGSGTFESSVINDGTNLYTWTSTPEGTFALQMEAPEDVTNPENYRQENAEVNTFNERVSYDCDPWRVDSSLFVPPSDIEFTNVAAMMEEMMQNLPEGIDIEGLEGFPVPQ